ncbi:hypothetical protein GH5_00529 [Leishmania sp. Ghana 2012 LV757]|uniref:hypothetical protein n=1 Tax=Leishmania sp. Ghana 2012 LV757 TaxID=2803181 RepID=UPI001B54DDD1|nr:hypothetical protein GH5_00529 [Leishmania sp. Ghana 2012 LV757]
MSCYSSYAGDSRRDMSSTSNGQERVTRILVVGEASVGKTLLIRRLCDHIFGDTSIEKSTGDVSGFDSPHHSQSAVDDDDLGPEWGPTLGVAVDALKRTTTVLCDAVAVPYPILSTLYDTGATAKHTAQPSGTYTLERGSYANFSVYGAQGSINGYGGANSMLQYRGQGWSGSNNFVSLPCQAPTTVRQHRQTVLQTVEFHELGGTHGYRDVARLPLRSIQYDGVMFVYHRRNLTSTLYLKEWYCWVRSVFSSEVGEGSHCSSGTNKAAKPLKAMPRFMLVGTQLPGDEVLAAAAGLGKSVKETLHIASGAISDETLLDGNLEVKLRTLQSPQTVTQRSGVRRTLSKVADHLAWPYHVCWCLLHPFFILSEQYQEERGPRNRVLAWGSRIVERFMWMLYQAEQTLLCVMAVILFGFHQEAVVLGHSRLKQTLEEMRKDELCVAQAHVCRLDSNIALQSSLDEIVAFFDILLRDDTPDDSR